MLSLAEVKEAWVWTKVLSSLELGNYFSFLGLKKTM